MARVIRLSRPAPQNGNDLAGLGMAFGRLGEDDYSYDMPQEDYSSAYEPPPEVYEPPPEESYTPPDEPAYEPPPEDTAVAEETSAKAAATKTDPASPGFNWAALNTGLKTATGLLSAGGSIYATQQQGKIAAGAQALQQTQAQLAAQQRAGASSGGILSRLPSWALPAIIGGVALLAIGGFMLTRRPATLTNPRRRRNRRRK